jgi:hypothetical protein
MQGPVTCSIVLSRLSICFVTSGGEDRNMLTLLERVEVPVYLGCDWQNVALHLPHTFKPSPAISRGCEMAECPRNYSTSAAQLRGAVQRVPSTVPALLFKSVP